MRSLPILPVLICLSFTGCQTLSPNWSKNWFNFGAPRVQDSKFAVPARMAILWSPAVLNQAGQVPTRGFGGRIYFYDAKNNPVAVEGQLVIYAYNNDKPNQDSKVPDRKFAFTPEQFTRHYTPTELGASYSIWIPWDAVGGQQAELSLVPIFNSTSGALVMGQPSRNLLPGSSTPQTQSFVTNCTPISPATVGNSPRVPPLPGDGMRYDPAIQRTSFQQQSAIPPANMAAQPSGLPTMSITLPGTMADRLAQSPPQVSAMQRLAQLRQEALAAQSGFAQPNSSLHAPREVPPATSVTAQSPGGVPQPWFPPSPQPIRSALPSPQVPTSPGLQQAGGPTPSQLYHAAQQSALRGSPEGAPY